MQSIHCRARARRICYDGLMDEVERLVKDYLQQGRMMQVATVRDGQPWICTVYFVADAQENFYWLSLPERRHSKEIANHSKVAVAVPIKFDMPVIGIQAEGRAEVVSDHNEIASAMKLYTEKYESGKKFYDNFVAGKNQHVLYRFSPKAIVLFDEVTYPEAPTRKEWHISDE